MTDAPQSKLAAKLAAAKAQKVSEESATQPAQKESVTLPATDDYSQWADLAPEPDFEPDPWDEMLSRLGILDAYAKWCGKNKPFARPGQREGIFISCPMPNHPDKDPSAWVNLDLNTWFCGGCQIGGDIYDIAAIHFGITNYKGKGSNFGTLRRAMATDLGYEVRVQGKKDVLLKIESTPAPISTPETTNVIQFPPPAVAVPASTPALPTPANSTPDMPDEEIQATLIELSDDTILFPTLDWKKVVTPGTFLDEYMHSTIISSPPEEYHFWNGLVALGLAVGRNVHLKDIPDVYGNIFVCLLGATGDGKSRSTYFLDTLINQALPFNRDDDIPKGAATISTPSSAEALVDNFEHEFPDPVLVNAANKPIMHKAPITGLVTWGEMAQLMAFAGRKGNPLQQTVMDFYDMKQRVSIQSRAKAAEAVEPFCSVITTAQPNALKTMLNRYDKSSGFLNRWVFASGKAKPRKFVNEEVVDLSRSVALLKEINDWARGKKIRIVYSPDGREAVEEFWNDVLAPMMKTSDEMMSRMDLLYKKLILLFCINEQTTIVTREIVEKVISMHQYTMEAYGIPADRIGGDEQTEVYQYLSDLIQKMTEKQSSGIAYSFLRKRALGRGYTISLIDKAIQIMERMGDCIGEDVRARNGKLVRKYRWTGS